MPPVIRNFTLLFAGCLLFHVAGSWSLPLIDRDEPRFAEASREMIERGDYVVPYFNNRYRFDKPPLTYWFQTFSYRIFGENDFAARLPSAVAASCTALVLWAWGRRLGSERLGWWAAVIFTLCLQTFLHAKAAVADMWLVLFVTAAHWAGYELLRDRLCKAERPASNIQHPTSNEGAERAEDASWWWIFYLALAFAFLAKGPIGWTPLLTVFATRIFLPAPALNRKFLFALGIPLMVGVVALWGIPALLRTDGEFFRIGIGRHVVERSVATMEGHGAGSPGAYFLTLPFFFLTIFLSFFPWSIKLPWLTRRLWLKRDATENYLIAGSAMIFLIFTLVKTKLPHYTLPAFPLLALLLARRLLAESAPERMLRRTALTAALIYLIISCATPFAVRFFPSVQLLRASWNELRPEMEFGAVGYTEPSLVWYFRARVKGWLTTLKPAGVRPFMEKPGARFVIVPTRLAGKIYPTLPPAWKLFSTNGINFTKGKRTELTLILKPG